MRPLSSKPREIGATLLLQLSGKKLNGVFKSESASIEISYGQVAGSSLFWDADLTRQMLLYVTCSANIIKNSIKGAIKLGGLGNASFSGTRI